MTFYPPSVVIPIYSIFSAIGIVLLGLRLWVRVALSPFGLGADDTFSIASVVLVSVCTAIQLWNSTSGTGGNTVDETFSKSQLETANKVNTSQPIIEVLAVGAIKLALLFFYRRIFSINVSFRRASLASIWLIVVWTFCFFVAQMSICKDKMHLLWGYDQTLARDYCGNRSLLLLIFAVTSMLTDLLVLGLPMVYVNGLQMPSQKKWAVSLIFLIGAISTFACLLRFIFLCVAYKYGTMEFGYVSKKGESLPVAIEAFNPTFWIMIEMWLGSWAANLLPMGPLFYAVCGGRRRQTRSSAPSGQLSHVYEMGSRRDKVHGASAVEEIDTDGASDAAPIMARSRDRSQVSL